MPTSTATSATRCRAGCRCARSGDGTLPADGNSGAGVERHRSSRRAAARVQSGVGPDLFGQQRDRSRLQRADHARLDGGVPRLAAARSVVEGAGRRSRRDGGAAERSPQRRRRMSCWPDSTPRSRPGATPARGVRGGAARTAREMGSRRRCASGGVALRSVRRRAVAADVRRRDGRAAVPEVLRVGRRRETRRAVFDHRGSRSRAGSTTSRRWRSANRATTSSCSRFATPRSSCRPSLAASRARGWDRVHAARFSHPLGNIGVPVPMVLQPRSGAGRGRRHDGDAHQLEPPDAVCGLGASVVAADLRRRRSGTTPG